MNITSFVFGMVSGMLVVLAIAIHLGAKLFKAAKRDAVHEQQIRDNGQED